MKRAFDMIDEDGSGLIDAEELQGAAVALGIQMDENIAALLGPEKLDFDKFFQRMTAKLTPEDGPGWAGSRAPWRWAVSGERRAQIAQPLQNGGWRCLSYATGAACQAERCSAVLLGGARWGRWRAHGEPLRNLLGPLGPRTFGGLGATPGTSRALPVPPETFRDLGHLLRTSRSTPWTSRRPPGTAFGGSVRVSLATYGDLRGLEGPGAPRTSRSPGVLGAGGRERNGQPNMPRRQWRVAAHARRGVGRLGMYGSLRAARRA